MHVHTNIVLAMNLYLTPHYIHTHNWKMFKLIDSQRTRGDCFRWTLLFRELCSLNIIIQGIVFAEHYYSGNCFLWTLLFRELFSLNIIIQGIVFAEHYYSGNCFRWTLLFRELFSLNIIIVFSEHYYYIQMVYLLYG
jgi:hypothetical protein